MTVVKCGWSGEEMEIEQLSYSRRWRKVGVHRRRTGEKVYESARIILSRRFKQFLGKRFVAFYGRATMTYPGYNTGPVTHEGDVIVLFFPDHINKKKEA